LKSAKEDDTKLDDKSKDLFAESLGTRERSAVMKALREKADVVIFSEKTDN